MADCSKTAVYFREKARMTDNCSASSCTGCGLSRYNNEMNMGCPTLELKNTDKAIDIVQKWSDEHPEKTILQDFMEKYPKAKLDESGYPSRVCPAYLGYKKYYKCTIRSDCTKCWDVPLSEVLDNEN